MLYYCTHMKLLLPFILFFHFTAFAQTDRSHIKRIPFTYLKIEGDFLCIYRSKVQVVQNDSIWNNIQSRCKAAKTEVPDFSKYTVWQRTSHGDCHALFTHSLFMDTLAKKMIWVENNHYGGCRAAKIEEFRIEFPNPPPGYTFELREISKDKWRK